MKQHFHTLFFFSVFHFLECLAKKKFIRRFIVFTQCFLFRFCFSIINCIHGFFFFNFFKKIGSINCIHGNYFMKFVFLFSTFSIIFEIIKIVILGGQYSKYWKFLICSILGHILR